MEWGVLAIIVAGVVLFFVLWAVIQFALWVAWDAVWGVVWGRLEPRWERAQNWTTEHVHHLGAGLWVAMLLAFLALVVIALLG